jgi:glycine/D-amino acid oxidase-like deaminating enzyme
MHSPATGKILADLILQEKTNVVDDVTVLAFERFSKGQLLHETAVL